MKPAQIVSHLLEGYDWAHRLIGEASVHRPRRGQIWVASFTGTSGQQWRSTGTADHVTALARAKEFEAAARVERTTAGRTAPKPASRLRQAPGGGGGGLTQREVGLLLGISERAVRAIEKRALRRLARHPLLREVWREFLTGELTEEWHQLSGLEIMALLSLTRSREERNALRKALELVRTSPDSPGPARGSGSERDLTARRLNFQIEPKSSPSREKGRI